MMNTGLSWRTAIVVLVVVITQAAALSRVLPTVYDGADVCMIDVPTIGTSDFTVAGWVNINAYSQPPYEHDSIVWIKGYTSLVGLRVNRGDGTLTFFMEYNDTGFSVQSTESVSLNTDVFVTARRSNTLMCVTVGNNTNCDNSLTVFDHTSLYDLCVGSAAGSFFASEYYNLNGTAVMAFYDSYFEDADIKQLQTPVAYSEYIQYSGKDEDGLQMCNYDVPVILKHNFTVAGWVYVNTIPYSRHVDDSIIWIKGYTCLMGVRVNAVDGTLTFFANYLNNSFSVQTTEPVPLNSHIFVAARRSNTLTCITLGNTTVCNNSLTVFGHDSSYPLCVGTAKTTLYGYEYSELDGSAEMAFYDDFLSDDELQQLAIPAPKYTQYLLPGEYATIPDVPMIGTSDFSIVGWVHLNAPSSTMQTIWSKDVLDTADVTYEHEFHEQQSMLNLKCNKYGFLVLTTDRELLSNSLLQYYTWTFVAVRRTGTSICLALDSTENCMKSDNVYNHTNNFGLQVGSTSYINLYHLGSQFLDGLTVMAFYDRYLDDSELAALQFVHSPRYLNLPTPDVPPSPLSTGGSTTSHVTPTYPPTYPPTQAPTQPPQHSSQFNAYCGRGCFSAVVVTAGLAIIGLIILSVAYLHTRKRLALLKYKEQQEKTESLPGISIA